MRYSTTGSSHWANSQPLVRSRNGDVIALGHNGNLVNTTELRDELMRQGVKFAGTTDTEVITALIAHEADSDLLSAVRTAVAKIRGAFSAAVMSGDSLVGFRDPYGVRPLCLGEYEGHPVISSETAGLNIIGAHFVREIQPGEIVIVDKEHGLRSERVELEGSRPALCIFEFIYFARPDSVIAGKTLHLARQEMGKHLAMEAPVEADLVIPVPDTGMPAAIGYASASGIPYAEGLIKNRYVHRTFIQPDDQLRQVGIRMKLNPLTEVIRGKRLVVVDDSIVRGNTTGKLVDMLFSAGAAEVHLRISSPPIQWPCFYGIDMATRAELIAANLSVDDIRRKVGATSLHYLTLDGLQASTGLPRTSSAAPASTATTPSRCRRSTPCARCASRRTPPLSATPESRARRRSRPPQRHPAPRRRHRSHRRARAAYAPAMNAQRSCSTDPVLHWPPHGESHDHRRRPAAQAGADEGARAGHLRECPAAGVPARRTPAPPTRRHARWTISSSSPPAADSTPGCRLLDEGRASRPRRPGP